LVFSKSNPGKEIMGCGFLGPEPGAE